MNSSLINQHLSEVVNKETNILYLSYDGLTDQLGQSQILPYLKGLSRVGYRFVVVSFEKKDLFQKLKDKISKKCKENNITWIPLRYHKKPPIFSTLWDLLILFFKVKSLHKIYSFSIVHCRSYITSLIGLYLKKRMDLKFVFDIRGFWADERIERNIWASNLLYKIIYLYFKNKEKQYFRNADFTVTLTEASRQYIIQNFFVHNQKIVTIPCSTFFENSIQNISIAKTKTKLIYVGSFRTAYLVDEMFLFFSVFKKKYSNAMFHILTNEKLAYFKEFLNKYSISENQIIINHVSHENVFQILSEADLGICFIKPSFSSIASSPTKFAEMLAANLPVVCNNIGDLKEHCKQIPYTYCFDELNENVFSEFVEKFQFPTAEERKKISEAAKKIYDIKLAIERYKEVYENVLL